VHFSDKLWEIGSTERRRRAYFLRTVVVGYISVGTSNSEKAGVLRLSVRMSM